MPASRPFRDGDFLINLQNGGHCRAPRVQDHYVLGEDFGIPRWTPDYIRLVSERVFGIPDAGGVNSPAFAAAITNRAAPGLYVREGDDTSNWEEYRQVLARRVAEATGGDGQLVNPVQLPLRRFAPGPNIRNNDGKFVGLGGWDYTLDFDGVQVWANYGSRREVSPRVSLAMCEENVRTGLWIEVPVVGSANSVPQAMASTGFREDLWRRICRAFIGSSGTDYVRLEELGSVQLGLARFDSGPRRGLEWTLSSPDVNIQTQITTRLAVYYELKPLYALFDAHSGRFPPLPANPTLPTWLSGLYVPERENFTLAQLDQLAENEVTRRLAAQIGREAIQRPMGGVVRPESQRHVPPAPVRDVRVRLGRDFEFTVPLDSNGRATAAQMAEEMRRITERVVREEIASTQPQPKPEPTRFGLLEVDLPAQPPKAASKADTDLAELQATFRMEREQRRAQAAAQAQMNRFDLLECDLPAQPAKVGKIEEVEVKVNVPSTPKPEPISKPVTQIADLTKARDVIELASMVACIEAEVATALWRRETN